MARGSRGTGGKCPSVLVVGYQPAGRLWFPCPLGCCYPSARRRRQAGAGSAGTFSPQSSAQVVVPHPSRCSPDVRHSAAAADIFFAPPLKSPFSARASDEEASSPGAAASAPYSCCCALSASRRRFISSWCSRLLARSASAAGVSRRARFTCLSSATSAADGGK